MPADPDQLAATVAALYDQAEAALAALITDRLRQGLDAPDWAVRRLAEINVLSHAATAVVDRLDRDGTAAVRAAVTTAYRSGSDTALADLAANVAGVRISVQQPPSAGRAMNALADAAVREIRPLHNRLLRSTVDTYRQAVTDATARTLTRAQPMRQAAQDAWAQLVARGITGYTDTAGRRWQLHSYVEMAVRTAAARSIVQGQIDAATANSTRLVTVPDLPGECRLCRPYEGKVLALWGATGRVAEPSARSGRPIVVHVAGTLEQARRNGLLHPNCRHTIRPYRPGLSRLPTRTTADPVGDAARQRQRAIERTLRTWRRRADTALTDDAREHATRRVNAWDAEMAAHLRAHPGLRRLRYREQPGAGHVPAGRTPH